MDYYFNTALDRMGYNASFFNNSKLKNELVPKLYAQVKSSIESLANTVGPTEVLPRSFQVTIVPLIVREATSAAVIAIGRLIFIRYQVLLALNLFNAHRSDSV